MTSEIKPIKAYKTWAVFSPSGDLMYCGGPDTTEDYAIKSLCGWMREEWETLKARGYRVVQVTIAPKEAQK